MKRNLLIILAAILQFGCGSDDAEVQKILTKLEIASSNGNTLDIGGTTTLTLSGLDQLDEPISIMGSPVWSSSNNNVSIAQDGIATAVSGGSSIIAATLEDVTADYTITVNEESILTSIDIQSPDDFVRLDVGETIMLSVTGKDQFNLPIDITSTIEWSSNNSNVTVDQDGKVTGVSIGNSIIVAKVGEISEEFEISIWDSTVPRTDIYVSDAGTNAGTGYKILKFDENGDFPEVFINTNLAWPQDIVFLEDQGTVLISNLNSNLISRFDATSGDYIDDFATNANGPTRMKIGADNLLYVLQWGGDGLVKRYELDGTFVDDFTSVAVSTSIGLDWDSDGNLYVSSFTGRNIRKFDTSGNDLGLFISSNLSGPTNIWFDDSGNLLANDWNDIAVKKFDSNGVFIENFVSGITQPEGVGFRENGNILIGAANGTSPGSVKEYTSDGTYVKDIVEAGAVGLINTNAVVLRKVN